MIGSNDYYYIFEIKNLTDTKMLNDKKSMKYNNISVDYVYLCINTGTIEEQINALPYPDSMDKLTSIVKDNGSSFFSVYFSITANNTTDTNDFKLRLKNQQEMALKYHMNIHHVDDTNSFPDWTNLKTQYPVEYSIVQSCKTVIIANNELDPCPTSESFLESFYLSSNGDDASKCNPILHNPKLFFPFIDKNYLKFQFDHAVFLQPFIIDEELRTLHMNALHPIDYKVFENVHDEYFNAVFFNQPLKEDNLIEKTKKIIDQLIEKHKLIEKPEDSQYSAYHIWYLTVLKSLLGKKVLETKKCIEKILFQHNYDDELPQR